MANYAGRAHLLYVTGSAPTSAAKDTNYTLLGLLTDVSVSRSRNILDKSNKDDGDENSLVAGRRSDEVSGSCVFDHTDNAGQAILQTSLDSAAGTVWFLVSSTVSGDLEFYGSGPVSSMNYSFTDEDISKLDFTIPVSGGITEASNT